MKRKTVTSAHNRLTTAIKFYAVANVLCLSGASAKAEDLWGCEVLLCLANPAGPMAAPYCVPPITKLFQALFKFPPDPFPKCNMAGAGNFAQHDPADVFEPCPTGTTALQAGALGMTSSALTAAQSQNPYRSLLTMPSNLGIDSDTGSFVSAPIATASNTADGSVSEAGSAYAIFAGIGDGNQMRFGGQSKVCVGPQTSTVNVLRSTRSRSSTVSPVGVYARVVLVQPNMRGAFNVTIDNKSFARVPVK